MIFENAVYKAGKNINLCAVDEKEIDLYLKWFNDPEVIKFLLVGIFPIMRLNEMEWFDGIAKSEDKVAFLITTKERKATGNVGLQNINYISRTAEAGTVIGEKDEWGNGYGTEAKRMIIDYGFSVLNLRKIYVNVFAENIASIKANIKAGLKEEARLKEHVFANGKFQDIIVLSIFNK